MSLCICDVLGRLVRGCPLHAPIFQGTPESIHVMLIRILENQEKIMSGLSDLQGNITAMQAEWTQFLADMQAALANEDSDAAVEAAAQLVAQQTAAMQAADPAAPAPAAPAAPSGTDTPAS